MAVVTLSPAEVNAGLLSALNLSLPTNQARLRWVLAKAAAKQQILSQLQQILASKSSPICGAAAGEDASYPLFCVEGPPGLSLPGGIAPLPELVPPTCLARPDHSKLVERRTEGVSGTGDSIGSDTENTSVGGGSVTSVSEETESGGENFDINSNAPCGVASFVITAADKVPMQCYACGEYGHMARDCAWDKKKIGDWKGKGKGGRCFARACEDQSQQDRA